MANSNAALGQRFLREIEEITFTVEVEPDSPRIDFVDTRTFLDQDHRLEWIARGVLVRGQPAIMGGAKKVLKTSLLVDLTVSLATGVDFLGYFAVPEPGRVGMISGESGHATIQETIRRICRAKLIDRPESVVAHWGFVLPHLSWADDLAALGQRIRDYGLSVVILDPLYLCLLAGNAGFQASNLYDVGPLLSEVTAVCLEAGATPILAHHNKLASARSVDPPELDDLAFAGVQEFARQWLLVGRRERYEPGSGEHRLWLNVGGSAGHSGCWAIDVDEGRLAEDFTGRRWHVLVRPAADERRDAAEQRERDRRERQAERDVEDRERMTRTLERYAEGETLTVLRESSGLGTRARAVLDAMVDDSLAERVTVTKPAGRSGSRSHPGYRLVVPEADPELDGEEVDGDES